MGSGFRAPAISPVLRFRESSHKTDYSSLARRPRRHLQTPQLGAVVARLDLWPARLRHDRGLFVELADQCGVSCADCRDTAARVDANPRASVSESLNDHAWRVRLPPRPAASPL